MLSTEIFIRANHNIWVLSYHYTSDMIIDISVHLIKKAYWFLFLTVVVISLTLFSLENVTCYIMFPMHYPTSLGRVMNNGKIIPLHKKKIWRVADVAVAGSLFIKRYDVLTPNLVNSQICEIGYYNDHIAPKFDCQTLREYRSYCILKRSPYHALQSKEKWSLCNQ